MRFSDCATEADGTTISMSRTMAARTMSVSPETQSHYSPQHRRCRGEITDCYVAQDELPSVMAAMPGAGIFRQTVRPGDCPLGKGKREILCTVYGLTDV